MLDMVHHVALNVLDYEKIREFYVEKLGFRVLLEYTFPSGTRRMDIRSGDCQLEIFWNPRVQTRPEGLLQGYRHLAFRVADIEQTVAWLNARGIETQPIRTDPGAGGRMTFFQDPEGLELELHE